MYGLAIERSKGDNLQLNRNLTDVFKFLSCIMIGLHHYSQVMVVKGSNNIIYHLFSTQGGWLGVAIFFFLSGYGLMKSELKNHLTPVDFFKRRLFKTYIPAVFVSCIWGIFLLFSQQLQFIEILDGVLWNFNDGVLWFIRVIVVLYISFSIFAYTRKKFSRYELLQLCLVCTFTIILLRYNRMIGLIHGSSVLLFFVGVFLALYETIITRIIRKKCPIFTLYFIFFLITALKIHDAEWLHLLFNYYFILTAIGLLAIFSFSIPNVSVGLSNTSYNLYLTHNKVLMLLSHYFNPVPLYLFVLVTILATVLFSYLRNVLRI